MRNRIADAPVTGPLNLAWWALTRVSLGLLVLGALYLAAVLVATPHPAIDYEFYMDATRRWLNGGSFYLPHQLEGPYAIQYGMVRDVLFPPVVLWLTVPFLYLPAALWWLAPVALIIWCVARLRPAPWTWPVILALSLYWFSWQQFVWGGPSMWIVAFESAGLVYAWPAVLILIKPTLAPFAMVGLRRRSWWVALGIFLVLCLPFGSLWSDWVRAAVINPTNGGILYSVPYLPVMFIPVVAWLGRRRGAPEPRAAIPTAHGGPPRTSAARIQKILSRLGTVWPDIRA